MTSMQGHILIAMPHLRDPYFGQALVLICQHDHEGAMGLIINKSFEDEAVKQIFPALIVNDEAIKEVISPLYFGGPVALEQGFLLHSPDFLTDDTLQISSEFSLTSNSTIIEAIKAGDGPRRFKMMLGYAGWQRGQLEGEIENGDWLFQDVEQRFVFEGAESEKWLRATQSFRIEVAPGTSGLA